MIASPEWVSAFAELVFALGAVSGGLWGVYTYRQSKRIDAAEWINDLFIDFYLNDRFEDIRRGIEYHYDDEIRPLIEGRITKVDREARPLNEQEVELLSQIDDLLNYFEHISYLESEGHIRPKDKDAMFEYWFELLDQSRFAAIRRYAATFGFEGIAAVLDSQEEAYIMIYGTLMRGYEGYDDLDLGEYLTYVDECTVEGILYDLGDYPGLVLPDDIDGNDPAVDADEDELMPVNGELHRIDDESILADVDEFERYDPSDREGSLYVRQLVRLEDPPVDAWVYVYNDDVADAPIVGSGDWRQYDVG